MSYHNLDIDVDSVGACTHVYPWNADYQRLLYIPGNKRSDVGPCSDYLTPGHYLFLLYIVDNNIVISSCPF